MSQVSTQAAPVAAPTQLFPKYIFVPLCNGGAPDPSGVATYSVDVMGAVVALPTPAPQGLAYTGTGDRQSLLITNPGPVDVLVAPGLFEKPPGVLGLGFQLHGRAGVTKILRGQSLLFGDPSWATATSAAVQTVSGNASVTFTRGSLQIMWTH